MKGSTWLMIAVLNLGLAIIGELCRNPYAWTNWAAVWFCLACYACSTK